MSVCLIVKLSCPDWHVIILHTFHFIQVISSSRCYLIQNPVTKVCWAIKPSIFFSLKATLLMHFVIQMITVYFYIELPVPNISNVHYSSISSPFPSSKPASTFYKFGRCSVQVTRWMCCNVKWRAHYYVLVVLQLTFYLSGEAKPRELLASKQDSVEVMSLITAQLKNVFPKTPLEWVLLLIAFR